MSRHRVDLPSTARSLLQAEADPETARGMSSYMRTDMAFYGVPSPVRKVIARQLVAEFPPRHRDEYTSSVRALWRGDHREEKYLAIAYARAFPRYVTMSSIPMYEMMVRTGAWWDLVDETAAHLVGTVLLVQRDRLTDRIDDWATAPSMWTRRTAILSQLRHRADTDTALLERVCTRNMADGEFFIRKAIGWALRQYGRIDPVWVERFVIEHETVMSGLTRREATKHLEM